MLRLRCKARSGSFPLPGLTAHSRLHELQAVIAALTGVPIQAQRLLLGFPPSCLDLSDGQQRLGELGIHSGKRKGIGRALRPFPVNVGSRPPPAVNAFWESNQEPARH